MLSNKRVWIAVAVVALLVLTGVYFARRARAGKRVHYETVTIDRGRIVAKVTASGTLSAIVTVQVGSQVSGTIQKLFADYNSPVHKGQLIAKLDPRLFEAAYAQAKANNVAAQGNLAKAQYQAVDAERQFKRSQELAARKLIAQADLDTAQATADAARAQVEAARGALEQTKAALAQAQVNLAYTSIYSPTNGVVISRSVDVGQTVAASLQAPTLFVIAEDLRKMQVDTWVAEADIGQLKSGMPATFTVDAYPGERFRGTVRQIRNAPQTQQNVVTYDAVIDIDNADLKLKPGMTANVTFVTAERDNALRVANAALRFHPGADVRAAMGLPPVGTNGRPAGGRGSGPGAAGAGPAGGRLGPGARPEATDRRMLWVLSAGKPQSVTIRAGISDGSYTEILEGDVHEGDTIITGLTGPGADGAAGPRGGFPRRMF